jgi:transposase
LTALRAARLCLAKPEAQRPSARALLAQLRRLDSALTATYHQVQAFCPMIRERRGHAGEAWGTAVQQTGVQERRRFVPGVRTAAAAVRAGLSRVWSHGPTEGCIHRRKRSKRQASGRAGVDFLRHRLLAPAVGAAA